MHGTDRRLAVLILTLNEADTLPISLGSVRRHLSDTDVLVLDSFSSDSTESVAITYGARVERRAFAGYATQRRFGLELLRDYEWVLMLDADEEITVGFAQELDAFCRTAPASTHMGLFRRKDFLWGRWLRRSSGYPTWFGRLVRPRDVSVHREINEEYVCDGDVAYLSEHVHHFPFAKGLGHWVDKHNRYSTEEARLLFEQGNSSVDLPKLISGSKPEVRKALKQIYMLLPYRPVFGFTYLYILKGGFLDGAPGFRFCMLRFIYECLINAKKIELEHTRRQAPL